MLIQTCRVHIFRWLYRTTFLLLSLLNSGCSEPQVGRNGDAEYRQRVVENAERGSAFLADNAKQDGVVTLANGLQYRVLRAGTGTKPTAMDRVRVHYRGLFINGNSFDSSYRRGEPAEFRVSGVIPGWKQALQMMHEGEKWELFIPSELAYGKRGSPPAIGPNKMLIFEVELLQILR